MKKLALILFLSLFVLSGCGGSSSSGTTALSHGTVSGVAATGAGIAGNVYIKDSAGHEATVTTTDGSYTFNVAGMTPPFMLKAEWVSNSVTKTLFSCVNDTGTANINPLTNMIVAVAANGVDPSSLYASPSQFAAVATNMPSATTTVRSKLQPLLDQYQADVDPVTSSFSANHTGLDLLLDNISVNLTTGGGNVSSITVTDSSSGALILGSAPNAISNALPVQTWTNQDAALATSIDVTVTPAGRAMIVWSGKANGIYSITARGPQDNTPVIISNGTNNCWSPKIASDGSGNAIAVWVQSNLTNTDSSIWAARYAAGTGWGQPVQISSDSFNFANSVQVSLDASGNAVALWHAVNTAINGNHYDIHYSRYSAASNSWSASTLASNGTNSAHNPHIALNGSGDGMAVWTQDQGNGSVSNDYMDVWCRRFLSGSWSGSATKVNSLPGNPPNYVYDQTAVAIDQSGNAAVVWIQGGTWANYFSPAGGWGTAVQIANNPGISGNCYSPDIAIDGSGNAIAVWQQQDGISSSFTFANRYSAGNWGISLKISDDSSTSVLDTHVKIDAAGNARAVWYQPEGVQGAYYSTIRSNAYTAGTGWGSAALVSTLADADGYFYFPTPRLDMNSSGISFTVWGIDSM